MAPEGPGSPTSARQPDPLLGRQALAVVLLHCHLLSQQRL